MIVSRESNDGVALAGLKDHVTSRGWPDKLRETDCVEPLVSETEMGMV